MWKAVKQVPVRPLILIGAGKCHHPHCLLKFVKNIQEILGIICAPIILSLKEKDSRL